jgi:hypothetical protein
LTRQQAQEGAQQELVLREVTQPKVTQRDATQRRTTPNEHGATNEASVYPRRFRVGRQAVCACCAVKQQSSIAAYDPPHVLDADRSNPYVDARSPLIQRRSNDDPTTTQRRSVLQSKIEEH